MDLLKYLEPMKDLPKRFSNLAFWRDVRKFKDEVVNALEYLYSWGTHIESSLSPSRCMGYSSYGLLPFNSYSGLLSITSIGQYSDGVRAFDTSFTAQMTNDCDIDRVLWFQPVLYIDGGSPSAIVDLSQLVKVEVTNVNASGRFEVRVSGIGSAYNLGYYVPLPKNIFTNPVSGTVKFGLFVYYRV